MTEMQIIPKMKFSGKVIKTGLAGAVIDIGSKQPAVLHISQLPHEAEDGSIKRVDEILQIGQTIDVWVRRVRNDYIELTTFKPLDLEWRDIKPGMTVKGTVVRLEKFGVFVDIGTERPGLVHISEMAHGYVRTPEDIVKEGDEVEASVLDVQRKKRQIKLSMKALLPEPVIEKPQPVFEEKQPKEKPAQRRRSRKPKQAEGESDFLLSFSGGNQSEGENDQTAMEMAMREAMDRAKKRKRDHDERIKRSKATDEEQDGIMARTLENKIRTN